MASATRTTMRTFGAIAALAGIEHGVGEVLQGSVAPTGTVFLSWPDAAFFRIVGGEPAMTVIPNLLVTGVLAILASLAFLAWVTLFAPGRYGGPVTLLLSAVMLLMGAGFGPPLLGLVLGLTVARARPAGDGEQWAPAQRSRLAVVWPWAYGAALISWLTLMPGTMLLDRFLGIGDTEAGGALVAVVVLAAFGFLALTIVTAFARDASWRPVGARTAVAPSR